MKLKKEKLYPIWYVILVDLLIIAVYVSGFYFFYYKMPRKLESNAANLLGTNVSEADVGEQEVEEPTTNITTTDVSEKFKQYFTDTVQTTENLYSSENISVMIDQYTKGTENSQITYYIADIYVANIQCLQSGLANDTYGVGYTDTVLAMDQSQNAVLAINGDYYGNGGEGIVIRNGTVYRSAADNSDVCVIYKDGKMETYAASEFDVNQAVENGAWQAYSFGPKLLDESGKAATSFHTSGNVSRRNPRSAIGYYEPGHYCMVVVDGREKGYSIGMTLEELAALFEELGCVSAYNLDGGKSSVMTFDDTVVNEPIGGGRKISDCVIIKELEQ